MEKKTVNHALILPCFIMLLALVAESRPRYIECSDTLECGLGYCCVLGNGRYSLPRCLPLGKVNDECRPLRHPPLNVTVSYPDGESVELTHVYSTMCPCQAGRGISTFSKPCAPQPPMGLCAGCNSYLHISIPLTRPRIHVGVASIMTAGLSMGNKHWFTNYVNIWSSKVKFF